LPTRLLDYMTLLPPKVQGQEHMQQVMVMVTELINRKSMPRVNNCQQVRERCSVFHASRSMLELGDFPAMN
jgi:hypothetical protein